MMVRKIIAMAALAVAASAGHAAEPLRDLPISVQVLDATGQPVSGGKVRFAGQWVGEGVTDGWARGVVSEVRPGARYVAYTAPGLLAARRIRVRSDDTVLTATIHVGAEPVAIGRVLTTSGQGIPHTRIYSSAAGGILKSDAYGHFRMDGLCLDGSMVVAEPEGFVESRREWIVEPFPRVMRFRVAGESKISLTVADADGAPIPDARCAAATRSVGPTRIRWDQQTGRPHKDGRYEIRHVRPGKVKVAAYAPGYETQLKELEIREGEHMDDLQFRLEALPVVAIKGVVVERDGRTPIAGARVTLADQGKRQERVSLILLGHRWGGELWRMARGPFYRTETDQAGRFELRAPIGRYGGLWAAAEGYDGPGQRPLDLTGPMPTLRFRLFRASQVYGRVQVFIRLPDGSLPPEETWVRLSWEGGRSGPRGIGKGIDRKTGCFSHDRVPPGPAELRVAFPGHPAARASFEVAAGQVVEPVLRFSAGARIIGKVADGRDGRPIPMARIEASAANGGQGYATTDDDGRFELTPMSAGRISLRVTVRGYAPVKQTIKATADQVCEVTIETSPGGRIEGRLADAWLFSPKRPYFVALRAGDESLTGIHPDETGRFLLAHILPGRYSLHPSDYEGTPIAKPVQVTVREGETTRVVLQAP